MARDSKFISKDEFYEVEYVAKKLNVPVFRVYQVMDIIKSNDREDVYGYIQNPPWDNTDSDLIHLTDLVMTELSNAEYKHSWESKPIVKQALILSEEAGEVSRAVNQYDDEGGSIEDVRSELIQTAAMCYRMLKNLPV